LSASLTKRSTEAAIWNATGRKNDR